VRAYQGIVAGRSLWPALTSSQEERLSDFAESSWGTPFNDSAYYAVRAARRRNTLVDTSGFFCSELVATAYQRLGVLASPPVGRTANNYIPPDFAEEREDLCVSGEYRFVGQQVLTLGLHWNRVGSSVVIT
jgi:hypothetical protein